MTEDETIALSTFMLIIGVAIICIIWINRNLFKKVDPPVIIIPHTWEENDRLLISKYHIEEYDLNKELLSLFREDRHWFTIEAISIDRTYAILSLEIKNNVLTKISAKDCLHLNNYKEKERAHKKNQELLKKEVQEINEIRNFLKKVV